MPVQAQARAANEPKNQWLSKKTAGINYLQVQVQQPPLNSVAARKAISMAIDREAIARGVFQGSQVPATAFLPEQRQLVRQHERSERDIREEIRSLEEERQLLKYERGEDYDVIYERRDPKKEVVRVDRDRKGRLALVRSAH